MTDTLAAVALSTPTGWRRRPLSARRRGHIPDGGLRHRQPVIAAPAIAAPVQAPAIGYGLPCARERQGAGRAERSAGPAGIFVPRHNTSAQISLSSIGTSAIEVSHKPRPRRSQRRPRGDFDYLLITGGGGGADRVASAQRAALASRPKRRDPEPEAGDCEAEF